MDKFKHKKSLGQNFLKDEKVLNNIIESVNLKEDDLVIEIGPGVGALTKKIQNKNVNLICYEVDLRTKPYLEKIKSEKTKIIFQDILESNITEDIKNIEYNNLYIIANLPYYITTPIIKKIIDENLEVTAMVLMVQNEVADRFNAKPKSKDYGSLTIYLNYYFDIKKMFVVPNYCFDPAPKVDSAVIKFIKKEERYNVNNEGIFFNLIKDAFKQKRKNLRNNLKNYNQIIIETILNEYNLTLQNRAEEVPIEVFISLANAIENGDY